MKLRLLRLWEETLLYEMECTRKGNLVGEEELRKLRQELQAGRSREREHTADEELVGRAESILGPYRPEPSNRDR